MNGRHQITSVATASLLFLEGNLGICRQADGVAAL
jgi:hypothetical protein